MKAYETEYKRRKYRLTNPAEAYPDMWKFQMQFMDDSWNHPIVIYDDDLIALKALLKMKEEDEK